LTDPANNRWKVTIINIFFLLKLSYIRSQYTNISKLSAWSQMELNTISSFLLYWVLAFLSINGTSGIKINQVVKVGLKWNNINNCNMMIYDFQQL
jgi:hypothetical protein